MITILNRKELMTDSSPEELARVKEALKAEDIEFEVRTLRSRGTIGNSMDAASYARANLAFSRDRQNISFVYRLYVRRCDYDRAWAAAYQEDGSK
jgi:hypothetical protein